MPWKLKHTPRPGRAPGIGDRPRFKQIEQPFEVPQRRDQQDTVW